MDSNIIDFVKNIREFRERRGLKPTEIARKAGITYDAYHKIERGKRSPSQTTTERLKRIFLLNDNESDQSLTYELLDQIIESGNITFHPIKCKDLNFNSNLFTLAKEFKTICLDYHDTHKIDDSKLKEDRRHSLQIELHKKILEFKLNHISFRFNLKKSSNNKNAIKIFIEFQDIKKTSQLNEDEDNVAGYDEHDQPIFDNDEI